jgi:single-strand DNA-binding protein
MNSVQLIGNVGSDPKIVNTSSGKQAITFTIATTEKYGETEQTTWHNIVGWGFIASKPIQKGQRVYVNGKISNRSYDDKDGNKKYISEIVAFSVEIIQKLAKVEPAQELPTPGQKSFDDISGNLPF